LNNFYVSPTFALVAGLVMPRMRATALALVIAVLTLVGKGIGPQLVGWGSEVLERYCGAEALRYSLLAVTPFLIFAAVHFYFAGKYLKSDQMLAQNEV
jgi:hypothetical protein